MSKKAALHNLGCKVNAYETEAMQEMLEKAGYEIVPFKEGGRCLCDQHLYRDEYCRPKVPSDAAPGKENESGCSGCCSGMLCAGTGGKSGFLY